MQLAGGGARGAAAAPVVVSGRGTPRGRAGPASARPAVESGMLHPELQTLLTAIDAAEADATTLAASLTDAQANWQPRAGAGWSVTQCLDHLARANAVYTAHFLPVVERAKAEGRGPFAGLRPTWFGRFFVRSLEPPPRQKTKTFANIVPASTGRLDQTLAAYLASHEPYRRLVHAANDVDVNRVVVRNPFVTALRIRASTALQVTPAHERRHLWQARQVLVAPGFPPR